MYEARALFNTMPKRSPVSWTILMSGYALHGPAIEALSLFRDMLREPSAVNLPPDPFVFSAVLRACASLGSLDHGRELHCSILKLNCAADLFVANGLVTMYASCGSLKDSERVFRGIRQPDLVSWTAMLSGCIKNGQDVEAVRLFGEMARAGIQFDAFALSIAIKASANLSCMEFGMQIHCCMIKMGFDSCMFLKNCLMEFYGRIRQLGTMRKVFDNMSEKDLVSWNTIISCHARYLCNEEAVALFRALMYEGPECDEFTLGSILQAVTNSGALNHGKEIHGYVIRAGFESNSYVISALLDMYIKCINHEITDRNNDISPLKLFRYFQHLRAELDEFIVASILKSCALLQDLETGKMIHSCILKLKMEPDPFVISSLIDMYAKCGILEASLRVFAGIENPGTVPWSVIIAGHCQNSRFQETLQLFRKMQLYHVKANEFTYTSAVLACVALGDLRSGKGIHCDMIRSGYESNASVVNTLINLYLALGQHQLALKLSSSISENEISWGSLIQAFATIEDHKEILKFFHKIQRSHGQFDHTSARYVLNSCGSPIFLNAGTQAHAYIMKRGLVSGPDMSNALIEMYSRCGSLVHAIDAFNEMPSKNTTSWTSIISVNVDHGRPTKALELFMQMIKKGRSPGSNTFVSVLKACAQLGHVDESFRFFILMGEVYRIKPSAQHYSCMVEVLGRAGLFREAEHFINSAIPLETGAGAGAPVWRTLLSSCRVHGNLKVAKLAAEKLVELEPRDFTANVLLEQVLLVSGKWSDASKFTKTQKTSSSWIEIRENIHEFVSDQTVTEEISAKLMELARKMEEVDYVTDKSHWLQNTEEYRGKSSQHTELMALAYGLVCLSHGTPIRVLKSARMCGDCHSACKFISTFIGRDIVIKDSCNFHHFKDGGCSCRDQW